MRFIYLLLITFVFTACGHHKIRFSRVDQKQKVVEINDISSLKKKSESAETTVNRQSGEINFESEEVSSFVSTIDSEKDETSTQVPPHLENTIISNFPETVEDSTTISREEADIIREEALLAERDGNRSMFWGIMIFLFSILALAALIVAFNVYFEGFLIAAAVFGIGVLVSLVLSMVFGIRSLRSRYNTPRGRKRAIIGIVFSSVYLFLALLNFIGGIF